METAQAIKIKKKRLVRMQSTLKGAASKANVMDPDLSERKWAHQGLREAWLTEKEFRDHTKPWTFHLQPGDYEGSGGGKTLGQTDYGKQTVSVSPKNINRYWEFQEGEATDTRRWTRKLEKKVSPTFWDGVVSDRLLKDIQGPPILVETTTKRKPLARYGSFNYKPEGKRSWEMESKKSEHKPLPKGAYLSEKEVQRHVALHEVAHMQNRQRTQSRIVDDWNRENLYYDAKDQEFKQHRKATILRGGKRYKAPYFKKESHKKYEQRMDNIAWDMKEGKVPHYPASRANKVISRKRAVKVAGSVVKKSLGPVGTAIEALNPPELGRGSDRGLYERHMKNASPWSATGIQRSISSAWKSYKKYRDKGRPLVAR